jgi:crotonobetainyl-CoA:carnitine CoA-transferase CaiB-like acyl-CoA transferase
LFDDPHLNESGGLVQTTFPGGIQTKMPKIPMRIGDYDFNLKTDPPEVGQYGQSVLSAIGYSDEEIEELNENRIVVAK